MLIKNEKNENFEIVEELFLKLYLELQGNFPNEKFLFKRDKNVFLILNSKIYISFMLEAFNRIVISYAIGTPTNFIFKTSTIINEILIPDEYALIDDFYITDSTNQIYFGELAKEKFEKDLLKKNKLKKCELCEQILDERYFKENICLDCFTNYNHLSWN